MLDAGVWRGWQRLDREGRRNLDIFPNAMVESGSKQGKYILYKSLGHKMENGVGGY